MSELLDIIHQDESLLVVNKPAGLVCHPTKGDAYSSLISRLRLHLGPENPIHLINRLDRETSGLVVVAKTDEAASEMRRRWEKAQVAKTYLAIVEGAVAEPAGSINAPIGPDPASAVAIKSRVCLGGAPSQTDFRVIFRFHRSGCEYSVLLVSPRTGRKHQIRVHLAHIGHPVVGDKIYGPDEQIYLAFVAGRMTDEQQGLMKLPNQALHAWRLAWDSGRELRLYTAEPEEVLLKFMGQEMRELAAKPEETDGWVRNLDRVNCCSDGSFLDLFKSFSKKKLTHEGTLEILAAHTEPNTRHTMRTKTLLLTAALSVAGMASSMAQVYSVNAVGYINVTMRPGFNMVANQLNRTPNNSLNNVISGVPVESQVLKFENNNYSAELYDGSAWIKNDGSPGTLSASPGQGFFFFNPEGGNVTVTLVGEVPQGTGLTVPLPPGFALVSSIVPQAVPLTPANGFPNILEAQFLYFNAATQNYDAPIYNDGTGWILGDGTPVAAPAPAVGTGFFFFNPNATTANWTRNFSVN